MVGQIYPTELKLIKVNSFDTESAILDTDFTIKNGIVSSKIYDNRNDFNLKWLISHFLMEMFLAPLYLPWCIYFATYWFNESMYLCLRIQQQKPVFLLLSYLNKVIDIIKFTRSK